MPRRILVIDDDRDLQELMTLLLEAEGYEVSRAKNGGEALERLRAEPLPHLIFLDHDMDTMSGPQFLQELETSNHEVLALVPIIMFTARTGVNPPHVVETVQKPTGIQKLLELAKHYTGKEKIYDHPNRRKDRKPPPQTKGCCPDGEGFGQSGTGHP